MVRIRSDPDPQSTGYDQTQIETLGTGLQKTLHIPNVVRKEYGWEIEEKREHCCRPFGTEKRPPSLNTSLLKPTDTGDLVYIYIHPCILWYRPNKKAGRVNRRRSLYNTWRHGHLYYSISFFLCQIKFLKVEFILTVSGTSREGVEISAICDLKISLNNTLKMENPAPLKLSVP